MVPILRSTKYYVLKTTRSLFQWAEQVQTIRLLYMLTSPLLNETAEHPSIFAKKRAEQVRTLITLERMSEQVQILITLERMSIRTLGPRRGAWQNLCHTARAKCCSLVQTVPQTLMPPKEILLCVNAVAYWIDHKTESLAAACCRGYVRVRPHIAPSSRRFCGGTHTTWR
jgi:hypothetical protein